MRPDIKERSDQEIGLNPGEKRAKELSARETAALDQIEAGLRDDGFDLRDDEQKSIGGFSDGLGADNQIDSSEVRGKSIDPNITRVRKIVNLAKKRGGVIGLMTMFGVGGGLLAAFFGPATMLINLSENLISTNDTSSTVMERRFMKSFTFMNGGDPSCVSSKIKCKMGKISNSALSKMQAKGVTPVFDKNNKGVTTSKGYPKANPTHYEFDAGDGKVKRVAVAGLPGFLSQKDNRALASKILGTSGAFNMRFRAMSGKYLAKKLFHPLGIKRNGGITSEDNKGKTAAERESKFRESTKSTKDVKSTVEARLSPKMEKTIGKAKKGGIGYTLAVGSCIAVKAPKIIAGVVAAVQLAQIIPVVMDLALSPGSNAKGSLETNFSGEDADAAGTIFTKPAPRESDGKLTTALDSAILLAALGVNTGKLKIPASIVPGYSIMNNSVIKLSSDIDESVEPACNTIMSPAAMYSAMAVDSAITIAAAPTVIGGIIKIAGTVAVVEIVQRIATEMLKGAAVSAIELVAKNDEVERAVAERLGDVVGVSALLFFPSISMSRMIPTLTTEGKVAFDKMSAENEQFKKEMDIATLSPFDVSSKYTFLGSIVHNMGSYMIAGGQYNASLGSIFTNLLRIPAMSLALSSPAHAATNINTSFCGYATDYGLNTGDENSPNNPGINLAGMPCTGITPEQDSMTTEEAFELLGSSGEGWIDEEAEVEEWETFDDLIEAGFIAKDTPLTDFIESCGDPSSGDYLHNAASCVVGGSAGNPEEVTDKLSNQCYTVDTEEGPSSICTSDVAGDYPQVEGVKNPRSLLAISVLLIDMQVIQSINGEDDEDNTPPPSEDGEVNSQPDPDDLPPTDGWVWPLQDGLRAGPCWNRRVLGRLHAGMDINSSVANAPVYAMHDAEVIKVGSGGAAGNHIIFKSTDGLYYIYQHLSSVSVSTGQKVRANQVVGRGGKTGNVSANSPVHLHVVVSRQDPSKPGQFPSYNNLRSSINPMSVLTTEAPNGYRCT